MRRRVLRLALTTALLALLVFGLPLAVAVRVTYLDHERSELTRVGEGAAATVSVDALERGDRIVLPPAERDVGVGVYNRAGARTAGRGPDRADATVRAALSGRLAERTEHGQLLSAIPIRDGEEIAGAIRVSSSTSQLTQRTWLTWGAMAGLAALALAAATVLARRQASTLTRPLTELAGAARALGDGDFTATTSRSGVAEIDAASTALDDTATRLDDLLARERAFSANASHQLRTPLTGLRLTLEAALAGGDAGLRTATERAIDAADRLERTIDELLAVARSDTASPELLDVDALLDDLHRERAGPLGMQGRPLRIEREAHLPPATGSRAAVRQILAVLIDNATAHGAGAITLSARDAEDALALEVTDEGNGPPAGVDLFDRSRPRANAHGIGLPLARALAEAEGGRLVLSRPGHQPTFTLFLPTSADDAAQGPALA